MEKKKAIALTYSQDQHLAPVVIAKGQGYVAEKIIEVAKRNNIPLYNNPALAEELINLEILTDIPPELFEAVAKVLAYVYHIDSK